MSRPTWLKAIVGALLALSTWGATAVADGGITDAEWFTLLGAVVTGLGVYQAKNGESADPTTSTPEV